MSRPRKAHIPSFAKIRKAFEPAQEIIEDTVQTFAESHRDRFVQRIKDQKFESFDAAPLSEKYKAWKIKKGLDPRVMIRTGNYIEHIRVWRRRRARRALTIHVGFHGRLLARDAEGRRMPVLMHKVALWQEKGVQKIHLPKRPHWGPHLKVMRAEAPKVRKSIAATLRKRVKTFMPGVL